MTTPPMVDQLLTMGYDAITLASDGVYSYMNDRFNVDVKSPADTFKVPLPTLDQAAEDAIRQSQFDGALQGGVLGAGGIATIPMDIGTLIRASVRLAQRIAMTYGFGVRSEAEKAAIWTVLGEAAGVEDKGASVSRLLLESMPGIMQESPYHRVLMFKLVREIVLQLVWKEGQRGLQRLFPLAGSVIGAVGNYKYLAGVGAVAKKHYHDAHLKKRETAQDAAVPRTEDVARMEGEGNANPAVQEDIQEESLQQLEAEIEEKPHQE